MQHILVPTDFSIKSHNALALAKVIASRIKGSIHLVHVVEPVVGSYTSTGESLKDGLDDVYTMKLMEKLQSELESIKSANEDSTITMDTEIRVGDTYQELKKVAITKKADLIVIGAKGFTDADEFFLGSLTDKVVRSMPIPVVTVKELGNNDEIKNIVYATDLIEEHPSMMKLLNALQNLFNAQLHLVKINTRKKFTNDIDTKVQLHKLADKYGLQNVTLNTYSHEDEEYGIVYFADEKNADLIAMGVHERTGIRRLISGGSLADEVNDHTYRSVLTYHFDFK